MCNPISKWWWDPHEFLQNKKLNVEKRALIVLIVPHNIRKLLFEHLEVDNIFDMYKKTSFIIIDLA